MTLKPQFNFQVNVVTILAMAVSGGMLWAGITNDLSSVQGDVKDVKTDIAKDREDTKARRAYVDGELALAKETRLKAEQSRLDIATILKALSDGKDDRLRSQREQDLGLSDMKQAQAVTVARLVRIEQDIKEILEASRRSGERPFGQGQGWIPSLEPPFVLRATNACPVWSPLVREAALGSQ